MSAACVVLSKHCFVHIAMCKSIAKCIVARIPTFYRAYLVVLWGSLMGVIDGGPVMTVYPPQGMIMLADMPSNQFPHI